MKVLLLSRYGRMGASSRYRSYQYLDYLRRDGIEVTPSPLVDDSFLQRRYTGIKVPLVEVAADYLRRIGRLLRTGGFDLIWMEKQAFPWVPAFIESRLVGSRVPFIVDYDDPEFHSYDHHKLWVIRGLMPEKIDRVMRKAALVIAGNPYVADWARAAKAKRVEILPTVVDLERYPLTPLPDKEVFTIGWIGTPVTARYLKLIQSALEQVCAGGSARVLVIGPKTVDLGSVPVEIRPWSEETEVADLKRIDVGIMPLRDSPTERGKSGLKLIQYMACGLPVVGSPVGVNRDIINHGIDGFQATDISQWVASLEALKADSGLRHRMGLKGRAKVEQRYCLQHAAPKLASFLRSAAQSDRRGDIAGRL